MAAVVTVSSSLLGITTSYVFRAAAALVHNSDLVQISPARAANSRLHPLSVLATIIIRYSSHPSVVMMKPIQYRKCDDLSSTIGGAGVSS